MEQADEMICSTRNPRGILVWAFTVSSTPGYPSMLGSLEPSGVYGLSYLDKYAQAAWVIRVVDNLDDLMDRLVITANYGNCPWHQARLAQLLADGRSESLARLAVAHWCGKSKPSERAMAEAGGMSRRRATEQWAQLMRALIRADAYAMATIEPAFIARGWT